MIKAGHVLRDLDKDHKYFLVATVVMPLIVWWIFYGKRAYSMKGMK